jgi:hypothetical protein
MTRFQAKLERAFARNDWLALAYTLVLFAGGACLSAYWVKNSHVLGLYFVSLGSGFVAGVVYTLALVRRNELFITDQESISRNKRWISEIAKPVGYVIAVALLFAFTFLPEAVRSVLLASVSGALLGLWPGLLANNLRLRREGRS